jgi:hypothetical protein
LAHPDKPDSGHKGKPEHKVLVSGSIQTHPPPEMEKKHDAQRKEDDTAHKAERKEDAGFERKKMWLEGLTLAAVIVYAGIALWQGCLTRETITNGTQQFNMSNRPWVGIVGDIIVTKPIEFHSDKVDAEISYAVKNGGHLPAFGTVNMNHLVVTQQLLDPTEVRQDPYFRCDVGFADAIRKNQFGLLVLPNEPVFFNRTAINDLPQHHVFNSAVSVFLVGCIAYSDDFQRPAQHNTGFVYRYITDDGRITYLGIGTVSGHFEIFGISNAN